MSRERYSVAKSSSSATVKAAPAASANGRTSGSPWTATPAAPQLGQDLGQEVGGDAAVHQQRLGRVAHAGPVGLGVDRDRAAPSRGRPRRRRRRGSCRPRSRSPARSTRSTTVRIRLGATARDEHVDQPAGAHQGPDGVAAAVVEQRDRVGGEPVRRQGAAQHVDQGPVGRPGGRATAQHHGVAALEASPAASTVTLGRAS